MSSRRVLEGLNGVTFDDFARAVWDTRLSLADSLVPVLVAQWEALATAEGASVPEALRPGAPGREALGAAIERIEAWDRRATIESVETTWWMLGAERWFINPGLQSRPFAHLQALIEVAGGSASVFGYSSGAILALKAVADGVAVERLYLYEPPFRFDEDQPAPPADFPARLQALLDAGDPGAVVATFQIEWVGLPQEVVNDAQRSPMWAQLEAMAQSAVYDAVITTDLQRPTAEMAAVLTPTLVLQGDPTWPFLATAAAGIARRLPNATHRILPVEAVHGIDPGGTAAAIREFEQ